MAEDEAVEVENLLNGISTRLQTLAKSQAVLHDQIDRGMESMSDKGPTELLARLDSAAQHERNTLDEINQTLDVHAQEMEAHLKQSDEMEQQLESMLEAEMQAELEQLGEHFEQRLKFLEQEHENDYKKLIDRQKMLRSKEEPESAAETTEESEIPDKGPGAQDT